MTLSSWGHGTMAGRQEQAKTTCFISILGVLELLGRIQHLAVAACALQPLCNGRMFHAYRILPLTSQNNRKSRIFSTELMEQLRGPQ